MSRTFGGRTAVIQYICAGTVSHIDHPSFMQRSPVSCDISAVIALDPIKGEDSDSMSWLCSGETWAKSPEQQWFSHEPTLLSKE